MNLQYFGLILALFSYTCSSDKNKTISRLQTKEERAILKELTFDPNQISKSSDANQEQIRLDLIISALKKLPDLELQTVKSFGVDITFSSKVEAGSTEASQILQAWEWRREDFKRVMETMLKPIDYMRELLTSLKSDTLIKRDDENSLRALSELEYVVNDIDIARDFFVINGWPFVVDRLNPTRSDGNKTPIKQRTAAAHIIGTLIKFSYDDQIKVLDPVLPLNETDIIYDKSSEDAKKDMTNVEYSRKNALWYLIENLLEPVSLESDELIRRSLYAISAAARGNVDVQNAILQFQLPFGDFKSQFETRQGISIDKFLDPQRNITFVRILTALSMHNDTSWDVIRKIWNMASDMLVERGFILDLINNQDKVNKEVAADLTMNGFLGDEYCSEEFSHFTLFELNKFLDKTTYLYKLFIEDVAGRDKHSEDEKKGATKAQLNVYKSALDGLIITLGQQMLQCPEIFGSAHKEYEASNSNLSSILISSEASLGTDERKSVRAKYASYFYIESLLNRISGLHSRSHDSNDDQLAIDTAVDSDDEETVNAVSFSDVIFNAKESINILSAYLGKRIATDSLHDKDNVESAGADEF